MLDIKKIFKRKHKLDIHAQYADIEIIVDELHDSLKLGVEMLRPEIVTDEHLEYLDGLRESGVTNMFGATSYIEQEFVLSREDAKEILMYWMKSFGKEDR